MSKVCYNVLNPIGSIHNNFGKVRWCLEPNQEGLVDHIFLVNLHCFSLTPNKVAEVYSQIQSVQKPTWDDLRLTIPFPLKLETIWLKLEASRVMTS